MFVLQQPLSVIVTGAVPGQAVAGATRTNALDMVVAIKGSNLNTISTY